MIDRTDSRGDSESAGRNGSRFAEVLISREDSREITSARAVLSSEGDLHSEMSRESSDGADPSAGGSTAEIFDATIGPVIEAMLGVARRILGDEFQAWDAVQEALIGLWELPELPPNPRGWLLRTVALRSLHQARSRARRRRHELTFSRIRPEASDRDSASIRLEQDELTRNLERLLCNLSEPSRQVVWLRMTSNLDYASIANELGIPIGTVRSRLSRTRDLIRDMLDRGILFRSEYPSRRREE